MEPGSKSAGVSVVCRGLWLDRGDFGSQLGAWSLDQVPWLTLTPLLVSSSLLLVSSSLFLAGIPFTWTPAPYFSPEYPSPGLQLPIFGLGLPISRAGLPILAP